MTTASEDWLPGRSPEIEHLRPPLQLLVTQVKHLSTYFQHEGRVSRPSKKNFAYLDAQVWETGRTAGDIKPLFERSISRR